MMLKIITNQKKKSRNGWFELNDLIKDIPRQDYFRHFWKRGPFTFHINGLNNIRVDIESGPFLGHVVGDDLIQPLVPELIFRVLGYLLCFCGKSDHDSYPLFPKEAFQD